MNRLTHDITELVGDSIRFRCTWKVNGTPGDPTSGTAIDFTGATAKLQLRVAKTDAQPVLDLTEASGVLLGTGVVSPNLGFDISAAKSRELGIGTWYYELEVTQSGSVRTYITGKIKLTQDITR